MMNFISIPYKKERAKTQSNRLSRGVTSRYKTILLPWRWRAFQPLSLPLPPCLAVVFFIIFGFLPLYSSWVATKLNYGTRYIVATEGRKMVEHKLAQQKMGKWNLKAIYIYTVKSRCFFCILFALPTFSICYRWNCSLVSSEVDFRAHWSLNEI